MNLMPNKLNLISSILLLLFGGITFAQGSGQSRPPKEQMEAMRIAFYTREMNLTSQEATLFWPIFNRYKEEESTLRKKNAGKSHDDLQTKVEAMSEEDAAKHIAEILDHQEKELALKRKYTVEISKALSQKKTLMFLAAEKNFKKELIRQMQERKEQKK
jgi:hypothetical protein